MKNTFINVLVLFFSLIIGFFIIEISFRTYSLIKNWDVDKQKVSVDNPVNCFNRNKDFSVSQLLPNCKIPSISINSLGFRNDEFKEEDLISKKLVFLIGESIAFGWGASDNKTTITGYLNDMFKDDNLIFINAGVPSTTISDSILYYENYLKKFNPQSIIIFTGWNDILTSIRSNFINKTISKLRKYSKVFEYFFYNIYFPKVIYSDLLNFYNEKVIDKYFSDLSKFTQNHLDTDFIILTLPTYLNLDMSYQEYLKEIAGNVDAFVSLKKLKFLYEKLNNNINKLSIYNNIKVVNIAKDFSSIKVSDRKKLFIGEIVHLHDEGNKKIAENLIKYFSDK